MLSSMLYCYNGRKLGKKFSCPKCCAQITNQIELLKESVCGREGAGKKQRSGEEKTSIMMEKREDSNDGRAGGEQRGAEIRHGEGTQRGEMAEEKRYDRKGEGEAKAETHEGYPKSEDIE